MTSAGPSLEEVVALCKRRGFIFPSSEIYGGVGSTYDYGHYGVLLKNNVKNEWWRAMLADRDDIVAIDSAIIQHPRVWEASGHLAGFTDPMVDCKTCKLRFRADKLEDAQCGRKPSKRPGEGPDCELTDAREFNLMFETTVGPVKDSGSTAFLRPETAQGIFINFKNVLQFARKKPPFGIAQIGKSFRNEITTGNFVFRTREFEQMEMEYFTPPADAERWHGHWIEQRMRWYTELGIRPDHLMLREHGADELSHYSSATSDIEYLFPMGWSELEGIANRGDFDLRQHAEFSGEKLEYFDQETKERYVPYVIEPAAGVDRALLAFLVDAYDVEEVEGRARTVLRLHPKLAPVKVAVLPLVSKEGMPERAREIFDGLRHRIAAEYDEGGSIGKRYRRQDEIGTPWGVTVDGADGRRRHGHAPRPRLARTGSGARRRPRRRARRPARRALDEPEARRFGLERRVGEQVRRVGEQVHLLRIGRAREQDQLVAAGVGEALDVAAHGIGVLRGARRDRPRVFPEEVVVVLEIGVGVRLGVVAEREVGERHRPGLALAARIPPGSLELLAALTERVGGAAAHDPAVAEPSGAAEGRVDRPTEDQLRRVGRDVGSDALVLGGARGCAGLRPDLPDPLQHRLEVLAAARLEVDPGGLVVVLAAADRDPEDHPAVGDPVHRRRLLGEQRGVEAIRGDQDRRRELASLGHRGRGGERDEWLEVRVGDPVERPQGREARPVGAARPLGQLVAARSRHRVRQSDPNVHRLLLA